MQVITTHHNADFDALASLVAAGKLYPQATAVIPASLSPNVREFVALYKDLLQLITPQEVDLSSLTRLIVTDTRQRSRLPHFHPVLDKVPEIHLFDHHPAGDDDLPATFLLAENVGATTTLLVEKLLEGNINITPFEATLFILGIFEDTGCLTYSRTTLRDVQATCRLWQKGVNLQVLQTFLHQPLTGAQRDLLDRLLAATEYREIRGVRVGLAIVANGEYVGGLADLTQKLLEIEDVDLFFTVASMAGRVYVTGRSRVRQVDLMKVVSELGGRGHRSAVSATVLAETAESVKEKLLLLLYRVIPQAKTVRAVMSSPVRTVAEDTTVAEAQKLMLRYGHSGFPVLAENRLTGIISRRDLDKALHHNLGHAPVKAFMSRNPVTVSPDTSIREVRRLMTTRDIGRLPVLENGNLTGIVTRTDVLRLLENEEESAPESNTELPQAGDDLTPLLKTRLPQKAMGKLLIIGQAADREKVKVYAVGGFVRDLLLGLPVHDLDLVVEPQAIPFAEKLQRLLGGRLVTHEQFGTAALTLGDGSVIDLATARQEFYARPAALPEVEFAGLKNDLFRRDFTINTLAFSLNAPRFGYLFDFFGGIADLFHGMIRVLYNLSFVEDPLRILRAVRFEQRFGFRLEESTHSLFQSAVRAGVVTKVSKERLLTELKLLAAEEKAAQMLVRLFELGVGAQLFPGVPYGEKLRARLFAVGEIIAWARKTWPDTEFSRGALFLAAILLDLPFQEARHLLRRLRPPKGLRQRVLPALKEAPVLAERLMQAEKLLPSELNRLLSGLPVEALLLFLAERKNGRVWQHVTTYWEKIRLVKCEITGHDLEALGYPPGPAFHKVLSAVRDARLDGRVSSREEELELARSLLAEQMEEREEPTDAPDKSAGPLYS
ncbi:MAG: CBS domain-containing protein [Firmicutes bacterium]|nr:CBS domain-containing protein [Bacillota bacterium]